MTDEELEQKVQELQREIDNRNNNSRAKVGRFSRLLDLFSKLKKIFSKLNQKILDSNGFMTKEGGYLCKAEWHAVMIGISFPAMAFMLPTPLGEFMIVAMLLMLRTGFKKLGDDLEGHMADVMHELAYMLVSAMLTIGYFTYFTGRRLKEIDVGRALMSILVG